jgi:ABC-type glycerol-3-phosphate transport system substrate-binding protein
MNRRALIQRTTLGASTLALTTRAVPVRSALAQDKVALEFWSPANGPSENKIITKLVDDYNSGPGGEKGISVNLRIKPDDADYVDYTTAMTSSGSPDVVMTYSYTPVGAWAANGFIQPLDDAAAAVGIKEEDFFPITWDMISFAGHLWGLLQEFDFYQLWWNKAIHTGEPPVTFDDLDTMAAEYNVTDSDGNLTQAGFIPWTSTEPHVWNNQWGGSFYDFDKRVWTIDRPENQAFLEWFLKYVDMFGGREKADALITSVPSEDIDIFQYGKVAFAQEGEWLPTNIKALELDLDYGITNLPVADGVAEGTNTTVGGNLFLLPTNAKHPNEAVHFIQHMVGTPEGVLAWCVPNSNLPPLKDPAALKAVEDEWPALKPYFDTLAMDKMVPPISSPQTALFDQLMGDAVDAVTYKQSSPADALASVAGEIKSAVERFQNDHPDWEGE